jgi:hypothetical protein
LIVHANVTNVPMARGPSNNQFAGSDQAWRWALARLMVAMPRPVRHNGEIPLGRAGLAFETGGR